AAIDFSSSAETKIQHADGTALRLEQALEQHPDGTDLRVIA
ncbi:MAG: 50S ribosomal protein L18e, partial [Halodesulfurarchaeum sp.]